MNSNEIKRSWPLVFISHATESDADIAKAFEEWIGLAYNSQVKTFVSSTSGIPPNTSPATAITNALNSAAALIVLLSPVAHKRDWLTYEFAKMDGRGVVVLPILCKHATIKDLPSPILTMHQIRDAQREDHFFAVIRSLDTAVSIQHNCEYETLRNKLSGDNIVRLHEHTSKSDLLLIKGTGIKVNAKTGEPVCPWCLLKGNTAYLAHEIDTDYDGIEHTRFRCVENGCNFFHDFCDGLIYKSADSWKNYVVEC